jgi:hypothetical protein
MWYFVQVSQPATAAAAGTDQPACNYSRLCIAVIAGSQYSLSATVLATSRFLAQVKKSNKCANWKQYLNYFIYRVNNEELEGIDVQKQNIAYKQLVPLPS